MKQEEYNNYKLGALKRKFKTGRADQEPGTFITKANQMKAKKPTEAKELPKKEEVAFAGMI